MRQPYNTPSAAIFQCYFALFGLSVCLGAHQASAQTVTPEFSAFGYQVFDLGEVPGLPPPYGGLTILADDPNTLYIGGSANAPAGAIFTVQVTRDPVTGSVTGFAGTAAHYADAPNIDGGLSFTPEGTILFTRYTMNELGQILPDNTYLSQPLSPLGVASSVGSHAIVPADFPGAGNLIMCSYNGWTIHHVPYTVSGNGEYVLAAQTAQVSVSGTANGPEGIAYVPSGSPGFSVPSMVISSYSLGKVVAFEADPNGLPDPTTARDMLIGLNGAEGAAIDPLTGDFIFSTFNFGTGERVVSMRGFALPTSTDKVVPGTAHDHTVFPNPTTGLVQLAFNEAGGTAQVEVTDPRGVLVHQRILTNGTLHTLDLSGHVAGLYHIRVVRDGTVQVERVVLH